MSIPLSQKNGRFHRRIPLFVLIGLISLLALIFTLSGFQSTHAAGNLTVEIIASPNLVVDSNVASPSTYAPSVATVVGRFCNTSGSSTIQDVYGHIGDGTTPGTYPSVDSASFAATHPLYNTGSYAFTHVGGRIGTADASRYVGDLAPGECKAQYWHFTYPRCENTGSGVAAVPQEPPCGANDPVWGDSVKPEDDLALSFSIWGENIAGDETASAAWTMTMRNEISAMANKIEPNPSGHWFNTNTAIVPPGSVITSNGILYELGNINQGFDNDGDYAPDYNAWLQPIGDPNFDPSCFRLIRTSGVLTISRSAQSDLIVSFDDHKPSLSAPYGGPLYFSNLPTNNNGVIGEVFYTFQALNGPCSTALTPYQEVASGSDNEKFNGDYGAGIPPVGSSKAEIIIDKNGPASTTKGGSITYNIPFANIGTVSSPALPLSSGAMPLVISDTIPTGLTFSSASTSFSGYTGGVTTLYSTDSGATFTTVAPTGATSTAPNNLIIVQWQLDDQYPASASGTATLVTGVPVAYSGSNFIENCADGRFGNGAPFAKACATTYIEGNNSIGDLVWQDDNNDGMQDGGENGLDTVTLTLYLDSNNNGTLDSSDVLLTTQSSSGSSALNPNYLFDNLPDANYIVEVDTTSSGIPTGYFASTNTTHAVDLNSAGDINYTAADFGFGPAINFDKRLISGDPAYGGGTVTYAIDVTNNRSGNGSPPGACVYTVWGNALDTAHSGIGQAAWQLSANLPGSPDSLYATAPFQGNAETAAIYQFNLSGTPAGTIQKVEAIVPIIINPTLAGTFEVNVVESGGSIFVNSVDVSTLNSGLYAVDVSTDRTGGLASWLWTDFTGNATTTSIQLISRKSSNPPGSLDADAVGYRITTNATCGDPNDTINPFPLTDTFDNTRLTFVSANPPETTVSGGTITWANAGPIYAGQTKTILVNFTAIQPPDTNSDGEPDPTGPITDINCADTTGAQFTDGAPVNDASDCVTHGINPGGTIGDRVWTDNNNDGVQDASESGLKDVVVNLYSCTDATCTTTSYLRSSTTDINGNYLFTGLPDGYYQVTVNTNTLPDAATVTWDNTYDDDDLTSSPDSTSGPILINTNDNSPANDIYLGADFGYRPRQPLIVGSVWHDRNNSATTTPDAGEEGLGGITVYALGPDCATVTACTTTTDSNGNFVFTDFANNDAGEVYTIHVDTTTGPLNIGTWSQTFDTDGTGTANQAQITISNSTVNRVDYSYRQTGASIIGDTIYRDWNGDGIQGDGSSGNGDEGESGISGVDVFLYLDDGDGIFDSGDSLQATQTTNGSGFYQFTGVPRGNYFIVVDGTDLPVGYTQTQDPDESGTCTSCDNRSYQAGVDGVSSYLTHDFGYKPLGTAVIGDFVWRDLNANKGQDGGSETGIANMAVTLYADDGDGVYEPGTDDALVTTMDTDATGFYEFHGLYADGALDYWVVVDESDGDLPLDGNGQPYILSTENNPLLVTDLAVGEVYSDADFGFTPGGIIGDFVWQDNNGDGFQDAGEPGIPNIRVYLCTSLPCNAGTAVATTQTGTDGRYEFTSLKAVTYYIAYEPTDLPGGTWVQTFEQDLPTADVPGCTTCDGVSTTDLAPGQIDRTHDFGFRPTRRLGDTVWIDWDGDNTRDVDEPGIRGVTVYLCTSTPCNSGSAVGSTTTDINGEYGFGRLSNGITYYVGLEPTNIPGTLTQTYDPDGTPDGEGRLIVMGSNGVTSIGGTACSNCDLNVDFGYRLNGPNSVSGTVFHDDSNDAVQDPGENITYPDVTIYLWFCGSDNNCATGSDNQYYGATVTNSSGDYTFGSLPDGRYVVSLNQLAPNLLGTDPTQTSSPTTYREVNLDQDGNISGAVNAIDQDFGVLSLLDLGDLPDTYGTTLNNNGARHTVNGSLYLGSGVSPDTDPNGQPDANAGRTGSGDDSTTGGVDDEDGVQPVAGSINPWGDGNGQIQVNVTGNGCLLGWIDWNDSGTFDAGGTVGGVSELLINRYVTTGSGQQFTITSPTVAQFGGSYNTEMFLRFRLFPPNDTQFGNMNLDSNGCPTAGNTETALFNLATGPASAGEVEDYEWQFAAPTAVTLQSIHAQPQPMSRVIFTFGLLLAGIYLVWAYLWRRSTQKTF